MSAAPEIRAAKVCDHVADMEQAECDIAAHDIRILSELGSYVAQNAAMPHQGLSQADAERVDTILRQISNLARVLQG